MINDRILKNCGEHIERVTIKSKESLIIDPVVVEDMDTLISLILAHENANPPGVEGPIAHNIDSSYGHSLKKSVLLLTRQIDSLKERVGTIEKYLQGESEETAAPLSQQEAMASASDTGAGVFQAGSPHPSE
jgi:hypothetical protein